MATPEQVDVWVGPDVGQQEHFADVLDDAGERLFSRSAILRTGHALPAARAAQHAKLADVA